MGGLALPRFAGPDCEVEARGCAVAEGSATGVVVTVRLEAATGGGNVAAGLIGQPCTVEAANRGTTAAAIA